MNTLFRTAGGVLGPTIAGAPLAEYDSPLVIQTPRGLIPCPLLPNATAFNDVFFTAPGISFVGGCDANSLRAERQRQRRMSLSKRQLQPYDRW